MTQLIKGASDVYSLETQKERQVRMALTVAIIVVFVGVGYFFLPTITKAINNWIDFGISIGKLLLMIVVAYGLWMLRSVLAAKYIAILKKISRAIVRTDLPTFLELVVANRKVKLGKFTSDIGKMRLAIKTHTESMEERKESMEEHLKLAEHYKKRSEDNSLNENERLQAEDNSRHNAKEAAADKKAHDVMQQDKDKMLKTFYFFERLRNNLSNETDSLSNKIERMRSQLKTSSIWKDAAQGATSLLGVTEFEHLTLEETRNKIAENEAAVMNMIADHEHILEKMEAKSDIMDEEGQQLLAQYSSQVSPEEMLEPSQLDDNEKSGTVLSMTQKYKELFPIKKRP